MIKKIARTALLCIVLVSLTPGRLAAQDEQDPYTNARFRLGPVALTPAFAVSDLGVDTNVFNEALDPKQDFTATTAPKVGYWMRFGRVRLSGLSGVSYVYFRKYSSQRSFNNDHELRLDLPVNRLTFYVADKYTRTRVRPGVEIDARARREENMFRLGANIRLGGLTTLTVEGRRGRAKYEASELFLGTSLSMSLNRKLEAVSSSLRFALTPLTTFALGAEAQRDRFDFSPERNADSVRIAPGFEFRPFALISGKAYVGFRRFTTLNDAAPDFSGTIAAIDLMYTLRATRFNIIADRDVAYSFDIAEPYYVLTGISGSITQKITQNWDAVARTGRSRLDYRRLRPAESALPGGSDTVISYGAGLGYRLSTGVRLGFDLGQYRRRSNRLVSREYDGVRAVGSIAYGY